MRTKALLGLAALAVSAATCVAQSNVYSLNIVGYVNVDLVPGFNLITDPLKPSNGSNDINNLVNLPDGVGDALLYKWTGTGWGSTAAWQGTGFGWDPSFNLDLGEAFFLWLPPTAGNKKVTFVGEVQTGPFSYSLPKGFTPVGNKIPVDANWPGKDAGNPDDQILISQPGTGAWTETYVQQGGGFGWDGPSANPDGPLLKVGQGVMYNNLGTAAVTWSRTFNPQ